MGRYYPVYLDLVDRRCIVIGGGEVAERKVEQLLAADGAVTVVSPKATEALAQWAADGRLTWSRRAYRPGDLSRAFLAIAATILPRGVRVIRSSTISIRETDYVIAARAIGAASPRIIARHVLPNTIAPFLIIMSSMFGTAILTEAGLSYLGLGISEPFPSWGRMATVAAQHAITAPWIVLFPGLAIMITVMGFAFAGDALRDIFDPRLRGE